MFEKVDKGEKIPGPHDTLPCVLIYLCQNLSRMLWQGWKKWGYLMVYSKWHITGHEDVQKRFLCAFLLVTFLRQDFQNLMFISVPPLSMVSIVASSPIASNPFKYWVAWALIKASFLCCVLGRTWENDFLANKYYNSTVANMCSQPTWNLYVYHTSFSNNREPFIWAVFFIPFKEE